MPKTGENKSKDQLLKIEINSGSDSDEEHELSHYMKDKVKLMKEVLKLIKPKKIKSMAPDCIKHLDIGEINSMLLEELLGISNKRLRYIFNGENVDRESSSSDSDEDNKPIDIISLDNISDDDIEITINPSNTARSKRRKTHKTHKIKKEKKSKMGKSEPPDVLKESERHKLMSVLELLELQARARAIKSQIALEVSKKPIEQIVLKNEDDSDPDAVIIESPEHKEIVLSSSSDSEDDASCPTVENSNVIVLDDETENSKVDDKNLDLKKQKLLSKAKKIKLIRHRRLNEENVVDKDESNSEQRNDNAETDDLNKLISTNIITECNEIPLPVEPQPEKLVDNCNTDADMVTESVFASNEIDNDEIVVINLDEDEMKGIENV